MFDLAKTAAPTAPPTTSRHGKAAGSGFCESPPAGGGGRVPQSLRAAASFAAQPHATADAAAWARVLVTAAKELTHAARESRTWDHKTQTEVLAALDEVSRLTAAAKSPVLAAHERRGAWRQTGVRSFADFRAQTTRAGRGAARREVAAAQAVEELDGGFEALASGALTPVHAERLGAIAGKLPAAQKSALLTGERAEQIKRFAQRHDAARFATKVDEMAAALSARQLEQAHQDARRRRHLELAATPDGLTRITGLLDPVTGHTVRLALDAASPRPPADDDRTRGQRQADALHNLASAMLGEARAPGHARPHVLITMDAETFRAARDHLDAASRTAPPATAEPPATQTGGASTRSAPPDGFAVPANGSDSVERVDGVDAPKVPGPAPVVRCQDGPLLPLSELARTLCDSQISRLVIGADSEPLDLGRSQRVFSPGQRRAVIARDGGCAWEGCATPARYCEVHHLDWWDDDHGHTDVARAALVCVFHHHELHRHHLDLERVESSDDGDGDGDGHGHGHGHGRRFRYRTVPRARTRTAREEAKRARLLTDARQRRTHRPDEPRVREQEKRGAHQREERLARRPEGPRAGGSDPPSN